MGHWIQSHSNKRIDPTDMDTTQICIEDIAHALSMLVRFSGHCSEPYTIACHCVHVSNLVYQETNNKMWALVGLLHDACEYSGLADIARPVKKALPNYISLEQKVIKKIYEAFNIPPNVVGAAWPYVKKADNIALITEYNILFDGPSIDNWTATYEVEPDANGIDILNHEDSKALFLYKYEQYSK